MQNGVRRGRDLHHHIMAARRYQDHLTSVHNIGATCVKRQDLPVLKLVINQGRVITLQASIIDIYDNPCTTTTTTTTTTTAS